MSELNPLKDLGDFAKVSLERHEAMQAATRREAATNKDTQIRRTFVELAAPKGFKDPPLKPVVRPVVSLPTASESFEVTAGAFYTIYTDDSGDSYLQGGSVTGGNGGSESIADIKVMDASTGPVNAAGTVLYLKATCKATIADGIMLPGCELTGATTTTTLADNHQFTTTALTGDLYLELGRWTEDNFYPSAPGNKTATGCIGNFTLA